ncbi:MAG: ROK family protein [Enterocloster asparagiformis]|nr:ROK family protein [Enterocloster asparagiformis]
MRIAALDIGGTSIKSGLWDGERLSGEREQDTCAKEGGVRLMERAVEILRGYAPFDAIGVSTAGQVDAVRGSIHYANDNIPGYTGVEVRRILEEAYHVPVAVENDVNSAALGEAQFGAGKGIPDFLCLTYGTGVGGAIVIGGRIYTGSSWSAGSFGGIVTHPEAVVPEVEYSGCYEKCASTTGLVKRAMEVDPSLTSGRAVFDAFDRPEVRCVVDEWVEEIVTGLVTLIYIFNPSLIVLGGGIMAQPYVPDQVRKRLFPRLSPGFRDVNVVRASLGNQAGLLGAAHLASGLL